jgi:hypothetical protein
MLTLFLQFEIQKIVKYFKTKTLAKSITGILFMLVFLFIGIGIYYFFVTSFRYINVGADPDIRLALSLFLYELFLLILAAVIVFSAMISSVFTLFRGENNNWILSSPGYKIFPRIIFIRSLFNSLLPLVVMFLPAILALNKVYNLGPITLFFILVSVLLFLILLNALTFIAVVGLSFVYYKISQKSKYLPFSFGGLLGLLLFLITSIIFTLWKTFSKVDLMTLFKSNEVDASVSIANMAQHFTHLITHPFAMEIINWQIGQNKAALLNFFMLAFFAVTSFVVWWIISPLSYFSWQKLQEGSASTKSIQSKTPSKTYLFTGGISMVLFKKEALISSRNFKGVLWFSFFFFIWLLQIAINMLLNHNIVQHGHDITEKIISLQIIQYIIAIYFISSFTLRFVFPSFSIEKKTSWIVSSAPINFTEIFSGKYLFYAPFFVTIGILMNYINSAVLKIPFTHAFYSMILFISVIIFIITLGLSLGALFPSPETDDPEAISTSMSGLFFTAFALIYGALSDGMLYITLKTGNTIPLMLFLIVTYSLIAALLYKTPIIIKNRESL